MNAIKLESYLAALGKSHGELVDEGILPPGRFIEVYPGALSIYRDVLPGVELRFWAENQNFESVNISLVKTPVLKLVYQHQLPAPYDRCITREATLKVLGDPIESKEPYKKPFPLGESGGWDKFDLVGLGFEKLYVLFEYGVDMSVTGLMFSLKETGYDRSDDGSQ